MTVSAVGGIDYTQWAGTTNASSSTSQTTNTSSSGSSDGGDILSLSTNTGCTDGKDDGKIGFFSAIGNTIKGVAKTAVNAVKGCFTDSEGNFSLGKTLMSVATIAVCTAFPAVGLAACVVGGVMGAVQIGKGIYNAATAETDAEAKEAWQNIGGGALTVGVSAMGAKASYNAVEASAAAASETGATAMSSLSEDASILQKASALGKDCVTSTKYNANQIATSAAETAEALKVKSLQKKVSKIEGATTDAEQSMINELNAREAFMTDSVKAKLNTIDSISESASNAAGTVKTAAANAAKHPLSTTKTAAKSASSTIKSTGSSAISSIRSMIKDGTLGSTIKNGLSSKEQTVLEAINNTDASYSQLVKQYGYESVAEVIQAAAGSKVATDAL